MATDVQEQTEVEKATMLRRIKLLMGDGRWRSGYEVAQQVGGSDSAATARLRDLRKPQHGGHEVPCELFPDKVWRYRLVR